MTVLFWGKPERAMPVEEWQAISADSAPPGVYAPNMSREDRLHWKAKVAGTRSGDPRVEIRKTAGAQLLLIVRPDSLEMSLNGRAVLSAAEEREFFQAVREARERLAEHA